MPDRAQILQALSRVIDPDKGADVVSLDMVQGLVIKDGEVGFSLEVSPSEGAAKEPLRMACIDAVRALPGVTRVAVVLTAHHDSPSTRRTRNRRRIIMIMHRVIITAMPPNRR